MTKKDYELVARGIRMAKPTEDFLSMVDKNEAEIEMKCWYRIIRELGLVLGEDNARFSPLKFREACGVAE